jgi:hypothetical protein
MVKILQGVGVLAISRSDAGATGATLGICFCAINMALENIALLFLQ